MKKARPFAPLAAALLTTSPAIAETGNAIERNRQVIDRYFEEVWRSRSA